MSGDSTSTNIFLANRTKISLIIFAIMAAFAVIARFTSYFYSVTATDIVYMNTFLPSALYYLSSLFDIAMMFAGYAVAAYYIIFGGIRVARLPFILSAVAFLLNYFIVGILNLITSRSVDILPLILYLFANYAAEFIRFVIIAAIALISAKVVKAEKNVNIRSFSPFATALNVTAFFSAIIVVLGKALVEFFNETLPFIEYFDSYDISTIIVTYLLIAVSGALGYFIAHLTANLITRAAGVPADAYNNIIQK